MQIGDAKKAASAWVEEHGTALPGFMGAFLHGSVLDADDSDALPTGSDVDVMVVLADAEPPRKLGKFVYAGALLEVSYVAADVIATPEMVLANYHLAGSFRKPGILADPSGHLTHIQAVVSRKFARSEWVEKRCDHAYGNSVRSLDRLNDPLPYPDAVNAWLFANGITTHVLLAAGLRNPTVRKRYLAARELLKERGLAEFYPLFLEHLGCADWTSDQTQAHLNALGAAFDDASRAIRAAFVFASDLAPDARAVAIGGSQFLIESGNHREAVFWMAATATRCQQVFAADAPTLQERYAPAYAALLADLGIHGTNDLMRRGAALRAFLPTLRQNADVLRSLNRAADG